MGYQNNSRPKSVEKLLADLAFDFTDLIDDLSKGIVNLKDVSFMKETVEKIRAKKRTKFKAFKQMKKIWKMCAISKEAYLAQVALHLDYLEVKHNLYKKVAIVPGTNKIDEKLLAEPNDQEFVDKIFVEVKKLIDI